MASAFFYGILIHPKILKRVLNNDASHLQICPAILTNYTRHQVKFADYPAIVPSERSQVVLGRDLTPDEKNVRGTLVKGLTTMDIAFLDVFEGDEYVRAQVQVHPLGSFAPIPATSETQDSLPVPTTAAAAAAAATAASESEQTQNVLPAQTYVWNVQDSRLDQKLWSYDEFVIKNAWKWIDDDGGARSETHKDFVEVDRAREKLREEMAVRSG